MSAKAKSVNKRAKVLAPAKGRGGSKGAVPPKVKVGRAPFQEMLFPPRGRGTNGNPRKAGPADEDPQGGTPTGPFPVDALPPVARNLVLQTAAAGRVPVAMPAAAVLGVGAAAIGRGLLVENDMGEIPGNLFVALVASSGTGKKLVFDRCMTPFVNLHHELADNWQRDVRPRLHFRLKARRRALKAAEDALEDAAGTPGEAAAERRAVAALNEVEEVERQLLRRPTLLLTDPNRLALARSMQGQDGEACSVMSSEAVSSLAGLLNAGNGNGQGSEGFVCRCYSGDPYNDARLTRMPITLVNPCLTLVSFIQPDVMRDLLASQKLADRGLLARFLMVGDDHNQEVPDQVAEAGDADGPWREMVRSLTLEYRLNQHGRREPLTVRASAEVIRIFSTFRKAAEREAVHGGTLADIEPFVRRWAEQSARIALVLHALQHGTQAHKHPLAQTTAKNAVRIGTWLAAHQVRMLDGYRISRRRARAEQMRAALLKHPGRTASLGKLSKAHGFKEEEARSLCVDFPRMLHAEDRPSGEKGGRPTTYVTAASY